MQEVLERAVREVIREPITILGASRTDAGVHAGSPDGGQVAAFTTNPDPDKGVGWPLDRGPDRLVRALNGRLPDDILIQSAEPVPLDFDPITGAKNKAYAYTIHTGPTRPLWDRHLVYHTWHELDPDRMQQAAKHLEGEHDFAALAQADHGRKTTVRTIFNCKVETLKDPSNADPDLRDSKRIRITVSGSGFLYNMVRIIAGTLVEAGRGRIDPDAIPSILESKDRKNAGPTLPPEGLRLLWIRYE